MAETLSIISVIFFIAAGGFLVATVVLWFYFKIPSVIGDLSGKNAKKSIERLRKNNEKTRDKSYILGATNAERGKRTETIKQVKKNSVSKAIDNETGLLNENKAIIHLREATSLLIDDDATGILVDEFETTELETSTEVNVARKPGGVKLTMIEEIIFVHTKEVI